MYAIDSLSDNLIPFSHAVATRRAYIPLYVKMKICFGCNLKCEMCNHWRLIREPPLEIERFKEALIQLAELGCRKVHFSGGEPLLQPRLTELIELTSSLDMRATLTTNGTLVDKQLARQLIESGLRGVNVSIDSPFRRVHDNIRGVEGAWKAACRATRYFRRYAHKGKIVIRLNTVVSRLNYGSLTGLPDFAHQLGVDEINLIGVDDHCGDHLALHRHHIQEFNTNISPRIAERGMELGLVSQESRAYPFGRNSGLVGYARRGEYAFGWYDDHPCFAPWLHSLIDFNGLVYICCMTREQTPPLGDLKLASFTEIWNGDSYYHIREEMFPPKLSNCSKCDDFIEQNKELYFMLTKDQARIKP